MDSYWYENYRIGHIDSKTYVGLPVSPVTKMNLERCQTALGLILSLEIRGSIAW